MQFGLLNDYSDFPDSVFLKKLKPKP